jgi:SAM-dependent methyltransferase
MGFKFSFSALKKFIKKLLPSSFIRKYNQYILKKNSKDFVAQPIEEVFTDIYKKNYWLGNQSLSGRGSELSQVSEIQKQIPLLLKKYNIRTILDLPCGDFFWMKELDLSNVNYIGADIVEELIEENKKRYQDDNISFTVLDLTKNDLPQAELILCRDCLVHLSFEHISNSIQNIKRSKSTYFLTTSFTEHNKNIDIPTGNWRPLNFMKHPYKWPSPLEIINEKCTEDNGEWADKSLALWRIEDIPNV